MNIHSAPKTAALAPPAGKREEILRAALEVIAAQGFHGAPIAAIAEQAGVGAGTIYRYFENKDILIRELFQAIRQRICAGLREGYPTEAALPVRFAHLGSALLRHLTSHPQDFQYLEQFHNSPYGVEFRRDKILGKGEDSDLCRGLLEEGLAQHQVKELPLAVLFALAYGPLIAVARDHNLGFIELDERLIKATVQACWDGIRR
jgi:AcrR family transcriptional regulator